MKSFDIFYHKNKVGFRSAETSWQAIDAFANANDSYVRKYLYSKPVTGPGKKQKIKKSKKKVS